MSKVIGKSKDRLSWNKLGRILTLFGVKKHGVSGMISQISGTEAWEKSFLKIYYKDSELLIRITIVDWDDDFLGPEKILERFEYLLELKKWINNNKRAKDYFESKIIEEREYFLRIMEIE